MSPGQPLITWYRSTAKSLAVSFRSRISGRRVHVSFHALITDCLLMVVIPFIPILTSLAPDPRLRSSQIEALPSFHWQSRSSSCLLEAASREPLPAGARYPADLGFPVRGQLATAA